MFDENVKVGTKRDTPLTEFQRGLPSGLTLTTELTQSHGLGRTFIALDGRGVEEPVQRRIWCLTSNSTDDAKWRKPFLERLRTLLEQPWPYVAAPREVGESEGGLYLIEENPEGVLLSYFKTDAGAFNSRTTTEILRQLLTGLASLHRRGIAHGGLQAKHVFLKDLASNGSNGKTPSPTVWVGGVLQGGLAWWSKGQFLDPDAMAYYPPEWKKEPHEPSFLADLYALGILTSQLKYGLSSPPLPSEEPVGWLRGLMSRLRDVVWATPADAMIRRLMQGELSNAQEALKTFQSLMSWGTWRWIVLPGSLLLVLSLMLFWNVWTGWSKEIRDGQVRKAELHEKVETLNGKLGVLELERTRDKAEIARLTESLNQALAEIELLKPKGGRGTDSIVDAGKIWEEIWGRTDITDDEMKLGDTKKRYESFEKGSSVAKHLADWWQKTRSLHTSSKPWFPSEPEMKRLFSNASRHPWDKDEFTQAETFGENLKTAGDKWSEWAGEEKHSYSELDSFIQGQDGEVQKILYRWRSDIASRTSWTIQFTEGTAPPGWGTYRIIWIIDDTHSVNHDWALETQHDYSLPSEAKRTIKFPWKVGEPLKLEMDSGRSYWKLGYRPEMFSQTISGPLAIWQLHRLREVQGEGCKLQLEVVDCPGPPRDLYKLPPRDLFIP